MRSPIRALGAVAALALLAAPSFGQTCLTTLYAYNNGGSVGGAVYFDLTVTNAVIVTGFHTNYTSSGTAVGLQVWNNPTVSTYAGNEAAAGWTQIGQDDGTAVSAGQNNPTVITLQTPLVLAPGTYPMALVAVNESHDYTTGGASSQLVYSDPFMTISLGSASNVPFTGSAFTPRLWNGAVCYTPGQGLYANFTATPSSGPSPLAVQFADTTFTSDPNGVQTWMWDFGDGSAPDFTQNPSHTYATCGKYTVTLSVTDTDPMHGTSTETKVDYIEVDPQLTIAADFTGAPTGGLAPHTVNFTDTSAGMPSMWTWDFGDGSPPDNTQNPSHTYAASGQYTVTLTATNACTTDTVTKVNYITVIGAGNNVVPDVLNYQFNEVRGTTRANVATGATFPAVGVAGEFRATDPGRSLFSGNEAGFGCNAGVQGAIANNDVNTGGTVNVTGSFTIMFWMRRDPASTTTNPFGYAFSNGTFRAFAAGAAGSGITFRGSPIGNVDSGFDVISSPGVWQHVALRVDDTAGVAEWYNNGLPSGLQVAFTPGTFTYSSASAFYVGSTNGGSEFTDHYDMDDFRWYSTALAPNDIFASALAEVASSSPYDTTCGGNIGATGRPTLGNAAYTLDLTGAAASSPAAIAFGIEAHLGGLLPFPLGGGCNLSVNPIIITATGTDPSGNASVLAPVPNDPSLAGGHIYTQFGVLTGGALVTSDALDSNIQVN